jgi:hypothetical protein
MNIDIPAVFIEQGATGRLFVGDARLFYKCAHQVRFLR